MAALVVDTPGNIESQPTVDNQFKVHIAIDFGTDGVGMLYTLVSD